ncbi:hypothetical protein J6590_029299 [Homalodisca vitripennis]|nr:hypothetical protein J6590_029299 [Homalodisca vitripennis]
MASVQEKARCVLWFHESRSVITVQRRFRLEYGRNPPSNNSIKRWYRQFEQTGSVQHRKGAGRPPVSEAIVDQQDGAPPHWGKIVRDYLNDTFPGRWIGRDGPIPWPPLFAKKVQDIEELKNRVREVIGSITPAMLRNTWCEVEFRLQTLRANLGEHVELV